MSVNTNIIVAGSQFSGFKNYKSGTGSVTYAGGSIAAGSYTGPIRATIAMDNTNAVSEVQIRYTGIETFWRYVPGYIFHNYPTRTATDYQIQTFVYFIGATLYIDNYISNQTAGSVVVPAITFDVKASLYLQPFTT